MMDTDDDSLVARLPGFTNRTAEVNGVRLHYVDGGEGDLVVLLPGWPQTWWSWHKVMPELARHRRVVAVDLRGMGTSDKPMDGYDKKTMAGDIAALVTQLGYAQADIVGHDIGGMVAYACAANHADIVRRLVIVETPHPDAGMAEWRLLPEAGTFHDRLDENHPYIWWFAFHQVKGLPEALLEGRHELLQQWFFRYLIKNESAHDALDRAVYADAYRQRDAIRAGNEWYQAFPQDIVDQRAYDQIQMPVLGLAGPSFAWLKDFLERQGTRTHTVRIEGAGHMVAEEQPAETIREILAFLD